MTTQQHEESRRAAHGARRFVITLLLAVATGGCAAATGGSEDPFAPPSDQATQIRIQVVNNNFSDATIYAVRGGQQRRLGIISGKTENTYTVDWNLDELLQMRVDLLGGSTCTTPPLRVQAGDRLYLEVPAVFRSGTCR